MSEHDDKQFEAYLAGDSPLSEHYRRAGEDNPPAALDARVLEQARQAVTGDIGQVEARRPWRWIAPLSAAAVIVLAASLVLEMTLPGTPFESGGVDQLADVTEDVPRVSTGRTDSDAVRERPRLGGAGPTDVVDEPERPVEQPVPAAVPMLAPKMADDERQRSVAEADRRAVYPERRTDLSAAQESIVARGPDAPSVSFADEPPAMEAPDRDRPARESIAPSADALAAAGPTPAQAPGSAAAVQADAQGADRSVDLFAERLAGELASGTARYLTSEADAAGYAAAPTGNVEISEDRLKVLSLMIVRRMVRDGREDEAASLLEETVERWPDIELPDDFPLPDPRDEP